MSNWQPVQSGRKAPVKSIIPTLPKEVMETQNLLTIASKFVDINQRMLMNLVERWEDEKGYENIEDYKHIIQGLTSNFLITKMTEEPFGFTMVHDTLGAVCIKFRVTSTQIKVAYEVVK